MGNGKALHPPGSRTRTTLPVARLTALPPGAAYDPSRYCTSVVPGPLSLKTWNICCTAILLNFCYDRNPQITLGDFAREPKEWSKWVRISIIAGPCRAEQGESIRIRSNSAVGETSRFWQKESIGDGASGSGDPIARLETIVRRAGGSGAGVRRSRASYGGRRQSVGYNAVCSRGR